MYYSNKKRVECRLMWLDFAIQQSCIDMILLYNVMCTHSTLNNQLYANNSALKGIN